jgi:Ataxin-3
VLRAGLERVCGLNLVHADKTHTVDTDTAFIINRQEHWLTIRKIGKFWWDLNSCLDAPEYVSDFKLDAYLSEFRARGYTIFIVKGSLPSQRSRDTSLNWHKEHDLIPKGVSSDEPKFKAFSGAGNRLDGKITASTIVSTMNEDEMMQQAIAMSLSTPIKDLTEKEKKDNLRLERLAALEKRGLK